jgi:predicted ribosomally synthesized peptide with SipW-like signal peptide
MSDNQIELSRRKILGSIGAVGAAGAGAGLGTSALFSDTEEFANNQITAGQLDLKMDWEEHYSFPQIYDDFETDLEEKYDVIRQDPAEDESLDEDNYTGLPDPNDPVVWVHDDDLKEYFGDTVIEAFPDNANSDPRGTFVTEDEDGVRVQSPCATLADVPTPGLATYNEGRDDGEDTDTIVADDGLARTRNQDTYDAENDEYRPLLNLRDVKPGDYGEFTFSAHLCDNPGYLWLQMPGGLEESENSVTDPEAGDDPDNDTVTDDPGAEGEDTDGELADNIRTSLWYDDNCNNRIDGDPKDVVAVAIADTSGSASDELGDIKEAADALVAKLFDRKDDDVNVFAAVLTLDRGGDSPNVALASSMSSISTYVDTSGSETEGTVSDDLPDADAAGSSPLAQALDLGREYLNSQVSTLFADGDIDTEDPNKQIVMLSDGQADQLNAGKLIDPSDGNTLFTSDYFDGAAADEDENGNDTLNPQIPDDDSDLGPGGTGANAETTLVARDVDGRPFLEGTTFEQPATFQDGDNKKDYPAQPQRDDNPDPGPISGNDGITIRTVAIRGNADSDGLAKDTMTSYATGDRMYVLIGNDATAIGEEIAKDINVTNGGETTIEQNITLSELADKLDPEEDGPLMLDGDLSTDGNDCFTSGATHCFGLAWWVPEDVDNRIQSDSAEFDLGFLTEQCRNNDNPGQTFENAPVTR